MITDRVENFQEVLSENFHQDLLSEQVHENLNELLSESLVSLAVDHFESIARHYLELISETSLLEIRLERRYLHSSSDEYDIRMFDWDSFNEAFAFFNLLRSNLASGIFYLHNCPERCVKQGEPIEFIDQPEASTSSRKVTFKRGEKEEEQPEWQKVCRTNYS